MGLFDSLRGWFGTSKPAPITEPSGSDGVAAPGGYLWRGETNADLIGHKLWLTLSNTLLNSIVVAAAARYFLNLISGTEWEAEPVKAAGADGIRAAEIVRAGLFDAMFVADRAKTWSSVVRKAALYKFVGFSMHEWIVRKRPDGLIVFSDLQHRPQYTIHWWDKVEERSPLLGVIQQTRLGHRYYLPRERLWYCADDTLTDDPAGAGMLRHTIAHTKRLDRYEQLEGIAMEGDLRGTPLMRAPIKKLQEMADNAKKGSGWVDSQLSAFTDFGANHIKTSDLSLLIDSEPYTDKEGRISAVPKWAVDILKSDAGSLPQLQAAIERCNREIARVIGAEFMLMGGGSSGSHAMHADKTDQFGNLIQSTLGEMSGFARNDLARVLVSLNGLDADACTPTLLPGAVSTEAVAQVTKSLVDMAQAGAPLMPGDPAVDQIRARLHLAAQPKITPAIGGTIPRTGKPAPGGKSDDAADAPKPDDGSVEIDVDDLEQTEGDAAAGLKRKRRSA
jgi:hypothetical protein